MRTTIRSLAVFIIVMLGMALLHGAIEAAIGSNAIILEAPANDIIYIRQVTGTVSPSSSPITPALTSLWQTQYYSFNLPLPVTFSVLILPPLFPSDAQVLTYRIDGGSAVKAGQALTFVVNSADSIFSFDYLTQKQVILEQDHYRVNQIARANRPYRYISTVYFTQPYQYSGFIHEAPTSVSSYTLSWDVLPQSVTIQSQIYYLIDSSIFLTVTGHKIEAIFLPLTLRNH